LNQPTPTPTATPTLTPTATPSATPVAMLTLSTTSISFGKVPIGDTSTIKRMTVTNSGSAAASFGSIATTGPNASGFQIVTNACASPLN